MEPRFNNLPATIPLTQDTAKEQQIFAVEAQDDDTTAPFNSLKYVIVGDDSAPAFFKVNEKGQILVKNDLRSAPGHEIQYKVCVIQWKLNL